VSARPRQADSAAGHELVAILDFGSQYTQLIARRVRENRVYCEIYPPTVPLEELRRRGPIGIVLSGGPQSVYEPGAPRTDAGLFALGVPILGICYGMQLTAHALGGDVQGAARREYGRAEIEIGTPSALFAGCSSRETVWMSHGDRVVRAPPGFAAVATTPNAGIVAFHDEGRRIYGIQFHPEVSHTVAGGEILRNFLYGICGARGDWGMGTYLEEAVAGIRERVAGAGVVCAVSGGVDSSVVAALAARAVGERLTAVFVDNGLMRKDEPEQVLHALRDGLGLPVVAVEAADRFLAALAGIEDPEAKRRTIGRVFIEVLEEEASRHPSARFLAQGTLYPDVIESVSVHGPSAVIKTHHNVGGLPEKLGLELVEPLRWLFKDEVRQLGRELNIPEDLIARHPFPGPGLGVRVIGEVTRERLDLLRAADALFLTELREHGLYEKVSQAFAVLLPVRTVGVMGDFRTYENVVALRAVETVDFMTADWSPLPHAVLAATANRIVNEVRGINRVVYDVTSKPPATIEWE
jgi:GMP synthase (glutamine-hydrolysing)